ncbi:hypothetical protein KO498_16320 [Lentibacter algarum]|uniref:hypothetical protein n=1 Tax=Lentibacter algarum TaxID=576131 RepID=UPI001C0A058A|nr:hypothetical protein [Lentibacter algarum]MBU2983373.1 hypothetical protein [Lentibacter algarum]
MQRLKPTQPEAKDTHASEPAFGRHNERMDMLSAALEGEVICAKWLFERQQDAGGIAS